MKKPKADVEVQWAPGPSKKENNLSAKICIIHCSKLFLRWHQQCQKMKWRILSINLKLILGLDISFYRLFDSVSKLASIIFQCFFFKNIRDN